jgi:hypothetical protein
MAGAGIENPPAPQRKTNHCKPPLRGRGSPGRDPGDPRPQHPSRRASTWMCPERKWSKRWGDSRARTFAVWTERGNCPVLERYDGVMTK